MNTIYGTIVDESMYTGVIEFDTVIRKCYKTEAPPSNARVFPDDCLIFPGFIDINACCTSRADTIAALNGGIVFVVNNTNIANLLDSKIDILQYSVPDAKTHSCPYYVSLQNYDVEMLDDIIASYRGQSIYFNCESKKWLSMYKHELKHELRRPQICEVSAITSAIELIHKYNLYGICNVSTSDGLNIINNSRDVGINVCALVAPHHVYFNLDMITQENRRFLQVNPPLRTKADNERLLSAIRSNQIDFVASDHIPRSISNKIDSAISGVPHLDTYGGFISWLIVNQNIDPTIVFKMCCKNPSEWISRFSNRRIGRILPDYEASITVLSMTRTMADSRCLYTKCNWSPFDLRSLPGSVETVYLNGRTVVDGDYIEDF